MSRFQWATVGVVKKETAESVSFTLIPETGSELFFPFKAGQYLTFKRTDEKGELRRTYSICSSPFDKELRVGVKEIQGGRFSEWANRELKAGDRIEIMPPMGRFILPENLEKGTHVMAFAAGSGITPILSHAITLLNSDNTSRFTLFFGNKNTSSIMFRETLEGLKNKFPDRFSLHFILSREPLEFPLFCGRLNAEKCASFFRSIAPPQFADYFLICGPNEMLDEVSNALITAGIQKERILMERFTAPGQAIAKSVANETVEQTNDAIAASNLQAQVTVILDGLTTQFSLNQNGPAILDAALEAGADVPYACKGAVCCTCKAKLTSGKVSLDLNYALSEQELKDGYILTCQAHPTTGKVVVDFDQT
jgi:ring-1,2-phenylacetyl-CoA epoxidase subunit PaaE